MSLWLYSLWTLYFVQVVVVLLCLVDPFQHCDCLVGEEEAGCFDFLWLVACVQFFLVSLVGYVM